MGRAIISFLYVVWSYIVAFCRLIIWTILMFFSGLQRTLFMRSEVVSVEFKVIPLLCDRKDTKATLAYIDKLYMENPDLAEMGDEINQSLEEELDDFDDEEDGDE